MRRAETGAAGFTLLEVLAAFLVFAVLFTVLAGTASEAFRMEGENRRRLEASLRADEAFAKIERLARNGTPPPVGEDVAEDDIFTLTTTIKALTPSDLGLDAVLDRDDPDASDAPPTSILTPNDDEEALLRQIDLVVAWEEGTRTVEVRRTTIALESANLPSAGAGAGDPANPLGGDDGQSGGTGGDGELSQQDMIQQMLDQLNL